MPPESVPSLEDTAAEPPPVHDAVAEAPPACTDFIIEIPESRAEPAAVVPASEPAEPAPVELAPVELAPVAQAPVEQAPVEPPPVEPAPVEQAPVEPSPEPAPVEQAPEPAVAPSDSRPCLDTIVEPTLVTHGRPFMLSATFLDPPPERPPLQSATIVEPIAQPVVAEPAQPEPPPAPISADGTLVMPIEAIGEPPPDRDSREQLHTLPLEGPLEDFEEEMMAAGSVPAASPSASQSLTPLELAIRNEPVELPVQRARPAVAALVAAALTAALFLLVMDRPEAPRAHAGVPLPFAVTMPCQPDGAQADSAEDGVTGSAQGLKIDGDDAKASADETDEPEADDGVSSDAVVKPKAKKKKAPKAKPRPKAKRPKAKAKAKAKRPRSKAKRKPTKKKKGSFLSQLPPKKSKGKKAKAKKKPRRRR